ncbi:MAG: hypothetical protein AB1657_04550 [Candidatus Micrarchaeota archaeon]
MVGFVEPGERLGEAIVWNEPGTAIERVFPVPKRFRELRDCALVVEHPYYTIEPKGNERIVRAERGKVEVVEELPPEDGFYLIDPKHGIPQGKKVEPEGRVDLANLSRIAKRVGLVACGNNNWGGYVRRYVDAVYQVSCRLGVAVEAPGGGAPKMHRQHRGEALE